MPIHSLQDQFAALIAAPSVSCTQPAWDQSHLPVIELLARWLGDLGFHCEVQTIRPGGLVLAGHSDTVPFDAALWQSDPLKWTEVGDRGGGLGVCDMKGFFPL